MSTCSDGDSFYVDTDWEYDDLGTMNGCYEDSGDTTFDLPVYFRGGEQENDEPVVLAVDTFGKTVIWVLAHYDQSEEVYSIRCKDSDESDASQIHPTAVVQWDCYDTRDYTLLDGVAATCGCSATIVPTPSPTPEPAPSSSTLEPAPSPSTPLPLAATCSDGDSFYVDAIWEYDALGTMNGCYEDSGHTNYDLPEYFRGGEKENGEPVVLASEYGSKVIWTIAHYVASTSSFEPRCIDSATEDASQIHPTEVIRWDCYDDSTMQFSRYDVATATCGCATTPAPLPLGLAATPTPAGGGDDGLSTGGIVGIVFAILTVITAFGACVCCSDNDCDCDVGGIRCCCSA